MAEPEEHAWIPVLTESKPAGQKQHSAEAAPDTVLMTVPITMISFLGHETLAISMDGSRFLTDPVLRWRLPILRRHAPRPDPGVVAGLQAVLISHLHLDHVNPTSLRMIPRDTPIVVPAGAAPLLRSYRFRDVHELAPGESLRFGEIAVTATPARHSGRRYPWGRPAGAVGYLIRGSFSVYFAGDTGPFDSLADLSGDLDVALLPIWGWGLRLPADHLSPETAAHVLRLLKPRIAIPVHWGTFLPPGAGWFYRNYLVDPPVEFVRWATAVAPDVRVVVLQPGESVELERLPGAAVAARITGGRS